VINDNNKSISNKNDPDYFDKLFEMNKDSNDSHKIFDTAGIYIYIANYTYENSKKKWDFLVRYSNSIFFVVKISLCM
jgi:hypothetical protein